jgi:hypothetical protein
MLRDNAFKVVAFELGSSVRSLSGIIVFFVFLFFSFFTGCRE